jgi:hypothetical protein
MAKLNTETVNKILAVQRFKTALALELGLAEQTIVFHLKRNKKNSTLTTIDALECMRDLLNYKDIHQCLDLMNKE